MGVSAKVNERDFRNLRRWANKQTHWAATSALTKTADYARNGIQKEIPQKFNTTRKWWVKKSPTGIKIKAAKKATMTSEVFTGEENTWLARHDKGDKRTPARGSTLIVPVYKKAGGSPDKADKKFAGFKPATWRKAKGRSTALSKYGRTNRAVKRGYPLAIQTKKGNTIIKRAKSHPFRPVFVEKRSTKRMKKRISFYDSIKRDVYNKGIYNKFFEQELGKALRGR